jgi:hypothetical protein
MINSDVEYRLLPASTRSQDDRLIPTRYSLMPRKDAVLSEREASETGRDIGVAKLPATAVPRSRLADAMLGAGR